MSLSRKSVALLLIFLTVAIVLPTGNNGAEATSSIAQVAHGKVYNTVALYIGNHRAIVDNKFVNIDPLSTQTKPLIQNARTLVPVRFIAENFGATVGWDDATSTVPITLGDTNILLKIGSRTMMVNGVAKTLDVTPIIHNKRTFVPLRAITEAFGKHVFYDRELIVVSDNEVLDAKVDKTVVDELINWFRTAKIPTWQSPALSMQQLAALDRSAVAVLSFDAEGELISQGSGFSLGNGLFATSLHVLLGGESFELMDNDGEIIEVTGVVAYDIDWDLAILRTPSVTSIPALTLGRLSTVKKGDQIVTIGSPLGLLNSVSTGIVSNIHFIEGVNLIQITAPLAPGSSGGPLLNLQGQVIGVTFMGIEGTDLNFVIPIDYLLPMYEPIKGMPIGSIPLVDLPVLEEPVQEPPTFKVAVTLDKVVNASSRHVIMHPTEPIIYIANNSYGEVVALNYKTGQEKRMSVDADLLPEYLTFANGELYVVLRYWDYLGWWPRPGVKAKIAILDPMSLAVKDTVEVDMNPHDLVVDSQGIMYITGPSSEASHLASFSRTGQRLSQVVVPQYSYAYLSPNSNEIYVVGNANSIRVYALSEGKVGELKRTLNEYLRQAHITPDGTRLYLGSGKVIDADLSYVGEVEPHFLRDIAFDEENSEVFIPTGQLYIKVYDTITLEHIYTLETAGLGEYLFYRDNELIVYHTEGQSRITVYSLILQ